MIQTSAVVQSVVPMGDGNVEVEAWLCVGLEFSLEGDGIPLGCDPLIARWMCLTSEAPVLGQSVSLSVDFGPQQINVVIPNGAAKLSL